MNDITRSDFSSPAMVKEHWTEVIEPRNRLLDLRLKDVWRYRDLLLLMVRRDIVSNYKQTILGPLWFFFATIADHTYVYAGVLEDRRYIHR